MAVFPASLSPLGVGLAPTPATEPTVVAKCFNDADHCVVLPSSTFAQAELCFYDQFHKTGPRSRPRARRIPTHADFRDPRTDAGPAQSGEPGPSLEQNLRRVEQMIEERGDVLL